MILKIISYNPVLDEECQRLGTKFKPLARSKKRAEDSDSQEVKKYSHHANSDTSESEAESDDSMSDLYPRKSMFSESSPIINNNNIFVYKAFKVAGMSEFLSALHYYPGHRILA